MCLASYSPGLIATMGISIVFLLLLSSSLPFTLSLHLPCVQSEGEFRQFGKLHQPPAPTPAPAMHKELFRRDSTGTCGSINAGYTGDSDPVCSGTASLCSFTISQKGSVAAAMQGCCEDTSDQGCTFYTACQGIASDYSATTSYASTLSWSDLPYLETLCSAD